MAHVLTFSKHPWAQRFVFASGSFQCPRNHQLCPVSTTLGPAQGCVLDPLFTSLRRWKWLTSGGTLPPYFTPYQLFCRRDRQQCTISRSTPDSDTGGHYITLHYITIHMCTWNWGCKGVYEATSPTPTLQPLDNPHAPWPYVYSDVSWAIRIVVIIKRKGGSLHSKQQPYPLLPMWPPAWHTESREYSRPPPLNNWIDHWGAVIHWLY